MRLKPIDLAAQWYAKHFPDKDFGAAVAENFRRDNGHVYACGELFAMGQDVCWDEEQKQIVDGEPNAWFVELAASTGNRHPLLAFMDAAPYPLRWCLWVRRNDGRVRAKRWDDLITKHQGKDE
jgi:hypothetical protein